MEGIDFANLGVGTGIVVCGYRRIEGRGGVTGDGVDESVSVNRQLPVQTKRSVFCP